MFVDSAVVSFNAGKGGDGCVAFRREKFIPRGGPNGGTGGKGGSVFLVSQEGINSLVDFRFKGIFKTENGKNGSGSDKSGRAGKDRIIPVPAGTVVKSYPDGHLLFDFSAAGMTFEVVKGGRGGLGNANFKSSVNQSPHYAQKGEMGETIKVILELKLIAFAGLVGFPNAGKSTLISKISRAKPKIADYPFTTLTPHLGVVYKDYDSLVVADIPGIIEGAHRGEGMGVLFLKHIERTRVLIFLLDASPYAEIPPLETLHILQDELRQYKANLLRKKFLVVANKIDLLEEKRKDLDKLKKYCLANTVHYLEISAIKDINTQQFKDKLFELYNEA